MALTLAAPADKDALIFETRWLSYNELLRRAWHLAEQLKQQDGEHLAIFSENSTEWAIAAYACWAAGKVLVPIDAQSTPEDVAYIIQDCRAALLFVSDETRPVAEKALQRADQGTVCRQLNGLLAQNDLTTAIPAIVAEDEERIATVIYTSGTTGNPKGVMLTFGNLHANLRAVQAVGYFPKDERVLLLLPLHHVLPLMGCLVAPLASGGTVVFSPSLARDDIIRTLADHRFTMLVGVPRFYELLGQAISGRLNRSIAARGMLAFAKRLKSRNARARLFSKVHRGFGGHLRYMVCGGAPLDSKVAQLFVTLGFRLCEGYGMTECATLITFPHPDEAKVGYCGKTVSDAQVELRQGEVVVKGPQVMRGYLNRPEETATILKDGWLHTGDLGEFDDEGNLRITGRKKEILVLPNGKNVNPHLSEAMLESHSKVAEAAVFLDGEVLHGVIVPNPELIPADEEDLESFLWTHVIVDYNQRVAPYRQLARLSVIQESLPRTRLGKLRRHLIADIVNQHAFKREIVEPRTEIERVLATYLLRVSQQVSRTSRLGADLGIDSMARLELREFIRKTWNATLEESELTDRLRLFELAQLVQE